MRTTTTLSSLLQDYLTKAPDDVCLRFLASGLPPLEVTVAELHRRARAVAHHLSERATRGDRVLVLAYPGLDYVCHLLGCFYSGMVAVPVPPPRQGRALQRLQSIVVGAGARIALSTHVPSERMQQQLSEGSRTAPLEWFGPEDIDSRGAIPESRLASSRPQELALIQYTSGSTSSPKGVMLTHRALLANVDALIAFGHCTSTDKVVSWLPTYHDMGLIGGVLFPLRLCAQSTLLAPSDFLQAPRRWLEAISTYQATISGASNFGYDLCARRAPSGIAGDLDLSHWRVAFCGAERVQPETIQRFCETFRDAGFASRSFCHCYGLAEATVAVSFQSPNDESNVLAFELESIQKGRAIPTSMAGVTLVSAGRSLPGVSVRIRDAVTGTRLDEGQIGEICVQGESLSSGYFSAAEATEAAFLRDSSEQWSGVWLRTGDLGFLLGDELFITGRSKDVIISRGVNHYPEDIEHTVVETHDDLRPGTTAAFGVCLDGEERLVLVQEVGSQGAHLTDLSTAIRGRIVDVHGLLVDDLVFVRTGTIPRTSSGKIQRHRCREQYERDALVRVGRTATLARSPGTPLEPAARVIAKLMSQLLEREKVEISDDFFALGGHSLLATQLVSRLRQSLGIEIPVRAVFEAPTPRALAHYVESLGTATDQTQMVRLDPARPYPLSFSQERMWLLHQLAPTSAAYNVAGAGLIQGKLDPKTLERAINHVVRCHDTLRSNFLSRDGVPQVSVRDELVLDLRPVDLERHPSPKQRALELGSELAQRPFAIDTEPLIRVLLCRLSADSHVLAVCMHHLVTDAWSMGIFAEQLAKTYGALLTKLPLPSPPNIGYFDYAAHQRALVSEDRLKTSIDYWREHLLGVRTLDFPLDHPRVLGVPSTGALQSFEIGEVRWHKLREFAAASGVTPFMVLLSAFAVLLYRYTGEEDLVIAVPIANRNHIDSESVVGTLVNTLPIRIRLNASMTVEQLLAQVSSECLGGFSHQDVPFELLVRELEVERTPGRAPLAQVMLDFQNARMDVRDFDGLSVTPCPLERRATQFDISLLIADNAFSQDCGIEYDRTLFEPVTIRQMCRHFQVLLEELSCGALASLGQLPLFDATDLKSILDQDRQTCGASASTLRVNERLWYWSERTPDATAVTDESGACSYAELAKRVRVEAHRLKSCGILPQDRVIVCLERTRDILVILLAVLEVGAIYIPLDPRYPAERVAYIAQDCEAKVVMTTRPIASRVLTGVAVRTIFIDEPGLADKVTPSYPMQPGDAGAYIIYTSGSTGRPKGVAIPLAALGNFLESMLVEPGLSPKDRWYSVTTVSFDIAALELFLPIVAGASVHIASAETAADGRLLGRAIAEVGATVLQATPATYRLLLESDWGGTPEITLLCGGEAMTAELAESLLPKCRALWNMYGPTETTIWSTLHRVERAEPRIPIGHAIRNTVVHILDENMTVVPNGITGEVWIGGDGLATGYFKRDDLTRERFVTDPYGTGPKTFIYRTGDRGRRRFDGTLECLGRVDHQIKLRGYRIEPGEIEAALAEQNALEEVVVVAKEVAPGDVRLVAYVVAESSAAFDFTRATGLLRLVLPEYMIPSSCVTLAALPRTPNGKLDRAALPLPEASRSPIERSGTLPADELELQIAELWSELLGHGPIYREDSFFQLGGHSLVAVRMLALVLRRWSVEIPMIDLLSAPALEQFANAVRSRSVNPALDSGSGHFRHLVEIANSGHAPALYCIHGAGGGVAPFFKIASYLPSDRPVAAFQARGVDGRAVPHESIEQMAQDYLVELRGHSPRGPYHLVGYCGGGIVAYEMAQRLIAQGEEVKMLALIDAYRPGLEVPIERLKSWRKSVQSGGVRALFRRFVGAIAYRVEYAARVVAVAWSRFRSGTIPIELRDFALTRSYMQAAQKHRMKKYPGPVLVIRATDAPEVLAEMAPDLGWTEYVESGLRVVEVPGNHETLVQEPNISHLARTLEQCLQSTHLH